MKTILLSIVLLGAVAGLHAEATDSLKTPLRADTLYVIPAGPVAGSFTSAARISVVDTVAGWARITVEGWVPAAAVADRMSAAAPAPAVQTTGTTAKPASQQCAAITKKGTRCKRNAEPGSIYCWQHKK